MTNRQFSEVFALGVFVGAALFKAFGPCGDAVVSDETVITRDTIVQPIPPPKVLDEVRIVYVTPKRATPPIPSSEPPQHDDTPTITDQGEVAIPITRKTYFTEDYKAVIEGWRAELVSMETYPKTVTRTITKVKKPRFTLSVGPGFSYDGSKFAPTVGVTVGFVLWSK